MNKYTVALFCSCRLYLKNTHIIILSWKLRLLSSRLKIDHDVRNVITPTYPSCRHYNLERRRNKQYNEITGKQSKNAVESEVWTLILCAADIAWITTGITCNLIENCDVTRTTKGNNSNSQPQGISNYMRKNPQKAVSNDQVLSLYRGTWLDETLT